MTLSEKKLSVDYVYDKYFEYIFTEDSFHKNFNSILNKLKNDKNSIKRFGENYKLFFVYFRDFRELKLKKKEDYLDKYIDELG